MTDTSKSFGQNDRLIDLISANNLLLMVISRFSISLGFGDKTVAEVCREDGVDLSTFLAVCNFVCGRPYESHTVDLSSLMSYLKRAHSYFLDFMLPTIRRKLIESVNCADINDVAFLILKFFDEYIEEVSRHMNYENSVVFPYVNNLLKGVADGSFSISTYSDSHESMVGKLMELKEIFIRHYHQKDNDMLNSALFDIITCGHDLTSHCEVEDKLLVPAVKRLEKLRPAAGEELSSTASEPSPELTDRETEVVAYLAKGLSTKEIADRMCLSNHTVATYRRNISAKLNIHSPAGLVIYAILHGIVDLAEVKNL